MTIKERNAILVEIDENTEKEVLATNVIYSDDFYWLPKEKQLELYRFCKNHATNPICRENLNQMRYAIAALYFGF
jgi:hypothetical protein